MFASKILEKKTGVYSTRLGSFFLLEVYVITLYIQIMGNRLSFWYLEEFDLLNKMGRKSLMDVCDLLETRSIKKGEVIHLDGREKSAIFFLKYGYMKVVGKKINDTRSVLKKGNVFGELTLFGEECDEKAIALEDGIICSIDSNAMRELLEKSVGLRNEFLKFQALKIKQLQSRLEDLLYKDSRTRIKEYIWSYVERFGDEKDGVICSKNLLSHTDIAYMTNTSRQTVSNVMSELRRNKLLNYDSRRIEIIKKITS